MNIEAYIKIEQYQLYMIALKYELLEINQINQIINDSGLNWFIGFLITHYLHANF